METAYTGRHHIRPEQSCLRGPNLPDDLLTGQHGDDVEDGGDLLAGHWQEGGDQGHDGLDCRSAL